MIFVKTLKHIKNIINSNLSKSSNNQVAYWSVIEYLISLILFRFINEDVVFCACFDLRML